MNSDNNDALALKSFNKNRYLIRQERIYGTKITVEGDYLLQKLLILSMQYLILLNVKCRICNNSPSFSTYWGSSEIICVHSLPLFFHKFLPAHVVTSTMYIPAERSFTSTFNSEFPDRVFISMVSPSRLMTETIDDNFSCPGN
jgi:hypothetical protein